MKIEPFLVEVACLGDLWDLKTIIVSRNTVNGRPTTLLSSNDVHVKMEHRLNYM